MKIKYNFNFIINYKPLLNYKNYLNNIFCIYCKNFFLFFLLLEFMKNYNDKNYFKLFIFKKEYYLNSFLRAPNRFKKAQIKIILIRYKIILTIFNFYELNLYKYYNKINLSIIYVINYLFYYFFFFESLLFFMEKKILFIYLNNNNLLKLFIEI